MKKEINFAWSVTTLCKFDYEALKKCIEENDTVFHQKKIVIFGAGIRGTSFSLLLQKFGYENLVFTDNNEKKIGGYINEFPIIPYEEVEKNKEHVVVIISVENGFAIKEQLDKSGFVENVSYFYVENHLYERYFNEFISKKNVDTLIMGDCGLTDISKNDIDYTNLAELLKQDLGENKTKVLAIHAMGMRAFYHILSAQIKYISVPKKVIVMANFETFTGKQHLLPRSQHARLIQMISEAVNNQDFELKEYMNVTNERFNNLKMDYFSSSQNVLKKMSKEKNDKIIIRMNYMYELKEDNECIIYMKKIIELCKKESLEVLFFVPPVNYMYAEELYGDLFLKRYQDNVAKLKGLLEREQVELLDLSFLLTSNQFADVHTIDETTNYEGRKIVSDRIVEKIRLMENCNG